MLRLFCRSSCAGQRALHPSPLRETPARRSRILFMTVHPLLFEFFHVLHSIKHAALDFEVGRSLTLPAPSLESAGADAPAPRQLSLVQMPQFGRVHATSTVVVGTQSSCHCFAPTVGND